MTVEGTARDSIILEIDPQICHACRRCLGTRVCPTHAIRKIDPDEPPFIDMSLCRRCMVCLSACPIGAIVRRDSGI